MPSFSGFPSGKVRFTNIPATFFSELLPQIDNLDELKVTLYAFWRLDRMEGNFRYLQQSDFSEDEKFMQGLAEKPKKAAAALSDALGRAVERGALLEVEVTLEDKPTTLFLLNTTRGQAAIQTIQSGDWQPTNDLQAPIQLGDERPNIFRLYEEHIGPLTPMIADTLRDAEENYPHAWIEEAVRIAVENNVRRWRYIEAILRSWKEEGRDAQTDRRDFKKERRKYIEGKFSEFIER
ncbi:MAG: DnaD domain protein [Chloroflexi bacterium]|nr:DnaD domain protein [Chloroflexota bacterium]